MKTAVLLMAYGAAAGPEDIPAYLADIRGGRPAGPELVAEIRERYRLMGGSSPLLDITRRQASALEAKLGCGVYLGMRHSPPTILEAVRRMKEDGCGRVVALPLTPFYSRLSVGAYQAKYREAVRDAGADFVSLPVDSWNDQPSLIEAWAGRVREAASALTSEERASSRVVFSAHSLPRRILDEGDPYPRELAETTEAIARASGLDRWEFAYQSRGRTPEPWLGPDVSELVARFAQERCRALVVVPVGFVSDHMETLYDDDILYKGQAEGGGMRFVRARSLNDDPLLIDAMAGAVAGRLAAGPREEVP